RKNPKKHASPVDPRRVSFMIQQDKTYTSAGFPNSEVLLLTSLVLCNISLIEEFRVFFFRHQGATTAHSRSYGREEQRRGREKEAEIVDRNLCYRALV
ncbi:MAG: hypothetical protein J5I98_08950, partial [Phaeodactylibacter sp.]|nr:hypothetical protein [Phaeodactylibacter sp.]